MNSSLNSKKVSFDDNIRIYSVGDEEDYLYRKDQKWYFAAIDRFRFQERINNFNNS